MQWFWRRRVAVVGLLGLLVAGPLQAVDSLGVGWSRSIARWTQATASSQLVALSQDSIWTWDVQPNSNLGPGTVERGGFALMPSPLFGGVATFLTGASVLHDGDETTAFDPDDFADRLAKQGRVIVWITPERVSGVTDR